jgi:low temperature requirement protein LtrA
MWYVGTGILLPNIRGTMMTSAALVLVSVALWIGSIHVEWPNQLALIFIAIAVDLFGSIALIWLQRAATRKGVLKPLARWFEFFPAINIEHRVERNNAFVSLVW